jgi:hypothetical protein
MAARKSSRSVDRSSRTWRLTSFVTVAVTVIVTVFGFRPPRDNTLKYSAGWAAHDDCDGRDGCFRPLLEA